MTRFIAILRTRSALIVCTCATALLIGHFMQSKHMSEVDVIEEAVSVELPELPNLTADLTPPPVLPERVADTRAEPLTDCTPHLSTNATPLGMVEIVLFAPCYRAQLFQVQTGELVADVKTDASGRWEKRLPALASTVSVSADIEGERLTSALELEHADDYQHVVLAWEGARTFKVRMTQDGEPAPDGVERENLPPGTPVTVGYGGGASFEVLTFQSKSQGATGVVRLFVDAEVTEQNCSKQVSTLAYQTGYLRKLRPTEISYTMPDCSRVGDVVSLQNLFRDMRLAAR